ncbi:hypothetical protein QR680_004068 [Steinernema hermaphroditum]|uniref:Uncharacterized protein n=1 Tax=Steinernema hermaphroditum TaxID=289476 RepID=A0AA39LT54_9BILA|nr:hypothetical protein QR680_004068 [Steinernema hermaphroditum]
MTFHCFKFWSRPQVSGPPVVAANELYMLDSISGTIDRTILNRDEDDWDELKICGRDLSQAFDYLVKTPKEVFLLYTKGKDTTQLRSIRLKCHHDGTLQTNETSVVTIGKGSSIKEEDPRNPFIVNETGIFKVTKNAGTEFPSVEFTDFSNAPEFSFKKVEFENWWRKDYMPAELSFICNNETLFGVDRRGTDFYLCSMDLVRQSLSQHHFVLPDMDRYEMSNLTIDGDSLYIVYSGTTEDEWSSRTRGKSAESTHISPSIQPALAVFRVDLVSPDRIEKLKLEWPTEEHHKPSVGCCINAKEDAIYLTGRCTLPSGQCKDTHIYLFEKATIYETGTTPNNSPQKGNRLEDTDQQMCDKCGAVLDATKCTRCDVAATQICPECIEYMWCSCCKELSCKECVFAHVHESKLCMIKGLSNTQIETTLSSHMETVNRRFESHMRALEQFSRKRKSPKTWASELKAKIASGFITEAQLSEFKKTDIDPQLKELSIVANALEMCLPSDTVSSSSSDSN